MRWDCARIVGVTALIAVGCGPVAGEPGFGYVTGEEGNLSFGMRAPCWGCPPTQRLLVGARVRVSVQDALTFECAAAAVSSSDPEVLEVVSASDCFVEARMIRVGSAS